MHKKVFATWVENFLCTLTMRNKFFANAKNVLHIFLEKIIQIPVTSRCSKKTMTFQRMLIMLKKNCSRIYLHA